jgi:hypothetical protein
MRFSAAIAPPPPPPGSRSERPPALPHADEAPIPLTAAASDIPPDLDQRVRQSGEW